MPRIARQIRRAVVDTLEDRRLLTATNRITNGDFAAAGSGWALSGNVYASTGSSTPNSPPGYAYFSGSAGTRASSVNTSGTLSQTVTIPAGATSAWLNFWYRLSSDETSSAANDTLNVVIKNTSGTTLATPYGISSSTSFARDVYVQAPSIDLGAFAGQTITVSFVSQNNATLGTLFRVDDVSLQAEVPTAAPAFAAPTMIGPGTPSTIGIPTLNTPVPTVRWNTVSGASGYGVLIEKLNTATGQYAPVVNSETSIFNVPQIKGTTFSPYHELTNGTYRWSVRAFDSTGKATAYAPALYFALNTTGYTRAVGIDISHYQTIGSWANIKTNGTTTTADDTSFIYAKATEGLTYNDADFSSYVSGARTNGIALGGYHFARPSSNAAVPEAQHFYNRLVAIGALADTNLIPMLDFEDVDFANDGTDATARTKSALSKWANDFCDEFIRISGGIVPVIYTFVSYAQDYLNTSLLRYPLWQAQYPGTSTIPNTTSTDPSTIEPWFADGWSMWQWTDARSVSGIGTVDSDVANADVATYLDAYKLASKATYTVAGTIFEDADNDGIRDAGEAGIADRTVFLDADGDGVIDTGERTAVTTSTGAYSFTGVLGGNYQVRQVVPGGSAATNGLVQSFKLAVGAANPAHDFGSRVLDQTPPTLVASESRFNYDAAARTIKLVFSEDLGSSLEAGDAVLTNNTTGLTVATTFIYDSATRTAIFTPAALTNGDYTLTIAAGKVSDAAGNTNAAMSFDFWWLAGDINRDRSVNFNDLVTLSQNYSLSGRTYAQGDLSGDGTVDFNDLVTLSQNYSFSLTPIAPPQAIVIAPPVAAPAAPKPATKKKTSDVLL